jgi:hypothetical protein
MIDTDSDAFRAAVLAYATDLINFPSNTIPTSLTFWQKSVIHEFVLQGRCRIPFTPSGHPNEFLNVPRQFCEACYESARSSPQLSPTEWLSDHEVFRPHRPQSALVTGCTQCGGWGRILRCPTCQGSGSIPTERGLAVLKEIGYQPCKDEARASQR